jgi:hypothetical protein
MRPSPPRDALRVRWPNGKSFAFTIFDDPDAQSYEDGVRVYSFLLDHGFRTTRGVWPCAEVRTPNSGGETCASARYRGHTKELQAIGFEVGYHHTTKHSSMRDEIIRGLDLFRRYFGHDPSAMANHYNEEAIYWGTARLTPPLRGVYTVATLGRTRRAHFGEVEGHRSFWGDLCRERVRYCRNFVYSDVNTLAACPWMPYHDPLKPFVNGWYASTEGSNAPRLIDVLSEANQDRLEQEGGACIMYTHFGHGYVERGRLNPRFEALMVRLGRKNGWFVPVSTLLDHLKQQRSPHVVTDEERRSLERRWLWEKLFRGTS